MPVLTPEMRLRAAAVSPPMRLFDAFVMLTPMLWLPLALPTAAVPAALVPM